MTTMVQPELFTFDEKTHVGRLNGFFMPSVTQVLGDNGFIDAKWFTEESRLRGIIVHAVLANIHRGMVLDWNTLHPNLHGYVRSGLALHADLKPEILIVEKRICNAAHRFHGAFDLKVRMRHSARPAIWDYKTGDVEFWAAYQLGAYDFLDGGGNDRYGVKLHADGSAATLVPFNDPDHFDDDKWFLNYLGTTHRRLQHGVSPLKEIINGNAIPGAAQ